MPVIGRALLFSLGFADGAVHVQDNLPQVPAFPQLIDPFAGGVRKSGQIAGLCQHLGLEPCHLACLRCRMLCRSSSDHLPHDRINREPLGIVGVFVACKPTIYRLANHGQNRMLRVLACPPVVQQTTTHRCQSEHVVHLPIGK